MPFLDSLLLSKTIELFMDSVLAENKSLKTEKAYRHNLTLFLTHAGDVPLKSIGAAQIRDYLKYRIQSVKVITAHQAFRVLRTFFKWCEREGLIENYPMQNMKPPKLPVTIIPVFSREQIQALISACPQKTFTGSRNRTFISIYLDTGMRESELIGLRLKDIDFQNGVIKVFGKGAKERIVHINEKARLALRRYMMLRDYKLRQKNIDQAAVFLSEELRPLTADGLRSIFRKIALAAGVPGHIHMLRHTFAIEYLRAGGNMRTLQKTLGHENVSTTMIYLNALNADDVINAHRQFSPGDRFL